MIDNIELFAQSALKIKWHNKNIYFDPFKINNNYNDADYIFITHAHYDHFSKDDILKVKTNNTKIIIPNDLLKECSNFFTLEKIMVVEPNKKYQIDDIEFETTYAYNLNKQFHKKEYGWVGYILNLDNVIYVAGDTDFVPELENIKCDIACVPIGGTYTMDKFEASNLIKAIKPKYVIPIHYETIVGSKMDALEFKDILKNVTIVKIIDF
jgi:L-ascorbate metabolism protein UlaG (beta-lactamase superfamily)